MNSKRRNIFLTLLVMSLLLGMGFELISLAVFYARSGHIYYDTSYEQRVAAGALDGVCHGLAFQVKPYFGYSRIPDPADGTFNSEGFFTAHELPLAREGNEVIVGIFGGSFAAALGKLEDERAIMGRELSRHVFDGRPVKVLNLAMQGHRQPQSLFALQYYLSLGQAFDVVLSVDGFNELTVSTRNDAHGRNWSWPLGPIWGWLVGMVGNHEQAEQVRTLFEARHWRFASTECELAMCYYGRASVAFIKERSVPRALLDELSEADWEVRSELGPQIADQWAMSNRLMAASAKAAGAEFFGFVQPNQYFPHGRDNKTIEWAESFKPDSSWAKAVKMGYPLLLERAATLRSEGVQVFDGTTFLEDDGQPAYSDACCHMFQRAYKHVLEKMTVAMIAAQEGKPEPSALEAEAMDAVGQEKGKVEGRNPESSIAGPRKEGETASP